MSIRPIVKALGILGLVSIAGTSPAFAADASVVTYRIDVKNVTAGNVLSPFLAVIHAPEVQLAPLGGVATPGVAALAETGNRAVLLDELSMLASAPQAVGAEGGPILPGETRSVEVSVPTRSLRQGAKLDVLAMIGRSNDSFIDLENLALSRIGSSAGACLTLAALNYDAGSEENTGNVEDFGPGGHPTEGAEGKISFDRGLNPRGNAPDLFGWGATAALVTVTRLN